VYISEIIFIGLFLVGVYWWKKYNNPEFFWALFPLGGSLILLVLQYLSENFLHLSQELRDAEAFIFLVLRGIAFIAFVLIFLRGILKKK